MRSVFTIVAVALVVSACTPSGGGATSTTATSATQPDLTTTSYDGPSYAGTVDAPDFPAGLEWINVDAGLTLDDLRGKVVLLDFWTYGCINCIHIIPDLERLEVEYPDELVVIGVHSAKFPTEARTDSLRNVVQRYGLTHPVVNDKDFAIWNAWGANAWPTVALIDPTGRAVGIRPGEGVYDAVEPVIAGLVAEFDAAGAIRREPLTIALEADAAPDRPLAYPGKVLVVGDRLWIADTGHNRIVEADRATGDVVAVYGSGMRGSADGAALEASFSAPQGLALGDGTLYVADTNNHLIRAVDLATGQVSTIAGTGEQGWPPDSGAARDVALSNPWDVVFDEGRLYIANAGTHQLWIVDLALGTIGPLVGNAREGTANGAFADAELAQPSGLALGDDFRLYFADAESSSIRVAALDTDETFLLVGGQDGLFDFGDEDGTYDAARLQHPLGVAFDGATLYVADTYNSKVKRVNVGTSTVTSWLGDGPGWRDGDDPLFDEPGGLSFSDGILYVADTNNHAVRIVDPATGSTETLVLKGIERFDPPATFVGEVVTLPAAELASGEATLEIAYTLPDGYGVNAEAPSSVEVAGPLLTFPSGAIADLTGTALPTQRSITLTEGTGTLRFDVTLIYCEKTAPDLCLIDRVRFEQSVTIGPPGPSERIVLQRVIADPGG